MVWLQCDCGLCTTVWDATTVLRCSIGGCSRTCQDVQACSGLKGSCMVV